MLLETGQAEGIIIESRGDRNGMLQRAVHEKDFVDQSSLEETVYRGWAPFHKQPLHFLVTQLVQEAFEVHIASQMHR